MRSYSLNSLLLLLVIVFSFKYGHAKNVGDLLKGEATPYVTYESNYSKILSRQVQFSGYGLGVDWASGLSLGVNYYNLSSKVLTSKYAPLKIADWTMKMNYGSFIVAYKVYEIKRFSAVTVLGNGFGRIKMKHGNIDKQRNGIYCFEPSLHARYYVLNWLALASQFGYRLTISGGQPTIRDWSSFKFDIGFTIAPFELYDAIKNNTIID